MKKLDLGCGFNKREDAVGVDKNPLTPADIHHDLDLFPYPFDDNTFDDIRMINVLEHLHDIVKVMEEVHRISKSNAIIAISVPHFSSCDFYADPTHVRAFSSRSFDYFIPGTELFQYSYSKTARFKKMSCLLGGEYERPWWRNPVLWWVNRHKELYERRFAFIYPQQTLYFVLEVCKK